MNKTISLAWFLRHRSGLTISELSEEAGVSAMSISRFENDSVSTMLCNIAPLADFFKVPASLLLVNDLNAGLSVITEAVAARHKLAQRFKEQQEAQHRTGISGEEYVYLREFEKLKGTRWQKLVDPNFANNPHSHFDILSFDLDGTPVCIEVKATKGSGDKPFYMSKPELDFAVECLENGTRYELHRVYFVDDPEKRDRDIYTPEELLDKFGCTEIIDYKMTRKE